MAPSPEAVLFAQDKLVARENLSRLGYPLPPFAVAESIEDFDAFAAEHGWPLVAKTPRGGYDGGGVFVLDDRARGRRPAGGESRHADPRAAARDPPRVRRPGRPQRHRRDRPLPRGRDDPGGRDLPRDPRPRLAAGGGPLPRRRDHPPPGRGDRRDRDGRGRVLPHRRRRADQRAGPASAQLGPLDDRGVDHLAVRAAPARGPRMAPRLDPDHRAGGGDRQHPRPRQRGRSERPGGGGARRPRRPPAPLRQGVPARVASSGT